MTPTTALIEETKRLLEHLERGDVQADDEVRRELTEVIRNFRLMENA